MNKHFSEIAASKRWRKIEFLDKGWSSDEKYYIETDDGQRLIIRLADISMHRWKTREYEAIKTISKLGIKMSQPIDFDICAGGEKIYILLSWLDGESLDKALPLMSIQEQYNLGVSAGEILKKIHSVKAPESQPDWETRTMKKIGNKIMFYQQCGYSVPNEKKLIRFINDNVQYLKNRPQTLQHGDFHPGNLILTPDKTIGVIDFNRTDYGDPWEEYVRLTTFSKSISIPFAQGQIEGYFGGDVPELFFRLMALYSALDAHFAITWAIPFGEKEIEETLRRSQSTFDDYRGFETYIPVWYE
jgi:aminoglycoside phosphotransferase (APT) family kinase protein